MSEWTTNLLIFGVFIGMLIVLTVAGYFWERHNNFWKNNFLK